MKSISVAVRLFQLACLVCATPLYVSLGHAEDELLTASHPSNEQETPVYTAVVLRTFAPLYQLDYEMRPEGYAIDVLQEVAARAGFSLAYHVVDNWGEAVETVARGDGDFIPAYGVTPETHEHFVFSSVVETVPVSIFVRSGNTTIHGVDTLSGSRIAVLKGGSAERVLTERSDIELLPIEKVETALMHLLSGEVDAFVFPYPVMIAMLRNMTLIDKIKAVGDPLHELTRSFLLRADDTTLLHTINVALEGYAGSEKQLADYIKWYGQTPDYWTVRRVFQLMFFLTVGVCVIFLISHYLLINKNNRRLRRAIADLNCAQHNNVVLNRQLEQQITERTARVQELERWHEVMLDREDRVIELKKEVNELLHRAGQPARYPSVMPETTHDTSDSSSASPQTQ